jgi:hypothetical protein
MNRPTLMISFVFSVSLCLCGDPVFAASPSLGSVMPRGVQRGTEVTFTLGGARLGDAAEVMFYSPAFTVTKLEVVNDGAVKATVKIAPDCRLGEHALRLRTRSGLSELRTVFVGALPVVDEKEPNTDFAAPQKINLNVTVQGVVQNEDVDYYQVEAKKGQRISAEVEAMRLGGTLFDPYVAILDAKRFELAASDDHPLLGQDGCASVVAPADGMYLVQVRGSAYDGSDASYYRLHVGTFPRPTAVVPAGGAPGEELELRFLGDPTGEIRQKVKLPAAPDPDYRVFVQDAGGVTPTGLPFRVVPLPNTLATGTNTAAERAQAVTVPGAFHGVLGQPGAVNFFKFAAKKGQVFDVHCYARRLGSPLDPVMHIMVAGGSYLTGADDVNGPDSYFRFTAPEDKEYILWVHDHLSMGGPTYFYRIEVTPVTAQVSTSVPRVEQFDPTNQSRQAFAVPRGNRFAALIRATRADLGGPLNVTLDHLPPGVTVACDPMDAGLDTVPVVLEAKSDAPLEGRLTPLTARPTDANVKAPCRTVMETPLVIGNNQTIFWRCTVDRTAVAVAEEAPFSVTVVEPKAPLVQNGSMNLKIVATRKPGFTAPITIVPLFNPPNVGSANSATIPEKATETALPMNAAANASARKWRTAVLAYADAGKGPVWVSSQLFTLEIAAPFVTFAMERSAGEQGKPTTLFTKVTVNAPFDGAAKATVVGLPAKVTTPTLDLTKDTKELSFPVTIDKTSPAGQHKNIFCQVVVPVNGEPVLHNVGGTELRVDVPIPPKANEPPKPAAAPAPPPAVQPQQPMQKRLSRLEQLRLEQEQREKAMKEGNAPPPASAPPPKKP